MRPTLENPLNRDLRCLEQFLERPGQLGSLIVCQLLAADNCLALEAQEMTITLR